MILICFQSKPFSITVIQVCAPSTNAEEAEIDLLYEVLGEGNGKLLQYSCLENPVDSMKRQKHRTMRDELPKLVGAQYATGDLWGNNSHTS